MCEIDTVGWDIGGAHLKVACVDAAGRLQRVDEFATPLWRGLEYLDDAVERIGRVIPLRYDRTDTISKEERDLSLSFDWAEGVVVSRNADGTYRVTRAR